MRCGNAVYLSDLPRLKRVGPVLQNRNDPDALPGVIGELMREHDFRDAVAIGVPGREVDHVRQVDGEHVPYPRRILIPDQLLHPAGECDDVGFAILVQVGNHYLIAALQVGGDQMLGEFGGYSRGAGGAAEEEQQKKNQASV